MSESPQPDGGSADIPGRTAAIFAENLNNSRRLVDRMFAILLILEWIALILVAWLFSPWAWAGEVRSLHVDFWAAVVLGGLTISLPVVLGLVRSGRASTRQSVAVAQSLLAALLIHLTGGRPEAHFHVFVSLAFLALYKDWRVMVTAGLVVAVDHYVRGIYWPRSVFGLLGADRWRWAEHTLWVGFEITVLAFGMARSRGVMREVARRQAEIEATRDKVEAMVEIRTAELRQAHAELEDRVRDRTSQWQRTNNALRNEIAERRKAEDELRANEERFRTLAEALPHIVWVAGPDGVNEYFNGRWYDYTGRPKGEGRDPDWLDAIHPDDRDRTMKAWSEVLSTGLPYVIEYRLERGSDGSDRWHRCRGLPIRKDDGTILRWFGTCTDVHEQQEAAEALRRAHDQLEDRVRERTAALEQANSDLHDEVAERRKAETEALRSRETAELATRAKSQFLANMSHEIRTPMNAIIGMTELTLAMKLPPTPRDNLEVVRVAADSLLDLIDDILDFSKIEAGRLDLEPIRFHPRETLDSALKTVMLRALEKGLSLEGFVDPEVPEALIGDPLRLRQILLNLLGNAIKFTARGRVDVRITVDSDENNEIGLKFAVSDQGIGIPSSRLSMIFDPFSQADGSTTRRFGGTGLGLSISSRLVELMGGRIWVDSEVGQGSVFHFTARFDRAEDVPVAPEEPADRPIEPSTGRSLRLLLVDDNELNRRVGLLVLERLGHEVQLAADGPQAVARYKADGPFDLVLMDVQMPEMDGFEATALIREVQETQGRRCPIVALTAFAMKGDRERCLLAGMDEHLAKPIRPEQLTRVVNRVLDEAKVFDDRPAPQWCLDPEEIRRSFRLDNVSMVEIVELFRKTCARGIDRVVEAIAVDDPVAVSKAAHGLTGSLAMFGSWETLDLAARLEEAGRSGDLAGASQSIARLKVAIGGMQTTLDQMARKRPSERALVRMADHSNLS